MLFSKIKVFMSPPRSVQIEPQQEDGLFLIRASDKTGRRAYYFTLVAREQMQSLREAIKKKLPFNIQEYGDIVASGYGDSVPESLRIRMRVEYGMPKRAA